MSAAVLYFTEPKDETKRNVVAEERPDLDLEFKALAMELVKLLTNQA